MISDDESCHGFKNRNGASDDARVMAALFCDIEHARSWLKRDFDDDAFAGAYAAANAAVR